MTNLVSSKIREIRCRLNLSQERFGKKIGVTGKTISAYETGRSKPSLKVLDNISDVYEVCYVKIKQEKREELQQKIVSAKRMLSELEELIV